MGGLKKNSSIGKSKTVTQIIREVRERMCDDYCKHPAMYSADEWEENADSICSECPLDKL